MTSVLDAIERRDWDRVTTLLHPHVHWTTALEEQLHGRRDVLAMLAHDPPPGPPAFHELCDGQVYRWIDKVG